MINLSPGYRHKLLDRIGTVQKWLGHVKSFQAYAGLRSLQLARQQNIRPPNRRGIYPLRCVFIVFSIEEFLLRCWSLFDPWRSAPTIRSNEIQVSANIDKCYMYIHFLHPERCSHPFERLHKQIPFCSAKDCGEMMVKGKRRFILVAGISRDGLLERYPACNFLRSRQITFQTVNCTNIGSCEHETNNPMEGYFLGGINSLFLWKLDIVSVLLLLLLPLF